MMMMYVHLNIHGAKISDENKRPNFLLVILPEYFLFLISMNIKICIKTPL